MLQSVLILVGVAVILYVAHLLLKAYLNKSLKWEGFQQKEMPAASAPVQKNVTQEPPQVVTPSGPNPPNAQEALPSVAKSPEKTVAHDPYQETASETPIRDNLRRPENSFGPGVENNGNNLSVASGVSSESVQKGASQFSPEFAQNGGDFMNGITASDSFGGDNYATI